MFLLCIIEENAPGGWILARFYRPRGGGFELFFWPGVGNLPIKKIAGVLPGGGGWSGLELTDTQKKNNRHVNHMWHDKFRHVPLE